MAEGDARVAQLAEHVLGKDEVIGSNPIAGSIRSRVPSGAGFPREIGPVAGRLSETKNRKRYDTWLKKPSTGRSPT